MHATVESSIRESPSTALPIWSRLPACTPAGSNLRVCLAGLRSGRSWTTVGVTGSTARGAAILCFTCAEDEVDAAGRDVRGSLLAGVVGASSWQLTSCCI